MTRENSQRHQVPVDIRQLTWASVLIGVGAVLWLAGVSLGSAAVVRAAKHWIRQLDQPPRGAGQDELGAIQERQNGWD